MADHLPHPQPAEVVPGSDCARKPPKEQRKPFKIWRIGLCAAELRLLCYGLYFIMQSIAVVLLRIQCRKQQLEFHSDRLLGSRVSIVDGVSFGQHALMKDARNQNASRLLAVKDNVPAAFHSTKAGTNIVARSAQRGIIGKHLATRLKIIDVMDGLVLAPHARRV